MDDYEKLFFSFIIRPDAFIKKKKANFDVAFKWSFISKETQFT